MKQFMKLGMAAVALAFSATAGAAVINKIHDAGN